MADNTGYPADTLLSRGPVQSAPAGDSFEQSSDEAVSVHRAFIYAALAPGFGEWYAGARIRGVAIFTAFLAAFLWGAWLLAVAAIALMDLAFGAPLQEPLPWFGLGASSFFAIALWYWGMAGAVEAAVHQRRAGGHPPQIHPAWGIAMSWLCPGAGQLSLGRKPVGFILLAGYVLVFPTLVPSLAGLKSVLDGSLQEAEQYLSRPDLVAELARAITARIELSFPSLAHGVIKSAAIALYCATLGPLAGPLGAKLAKEGERWTASLFARGASLVILGWICPGGPQLLQGREAFGWSLLGTYHAVHFCAGVLLVQDYVSAQDATQITSLASAILLASIADSLIRMIRNRRAYNQDSGMEAS
ncbi:MAG: hypothetical protein ACOCWR_02840 [Oceanidesulfovibrio sp.]